MDVNNPLKMVLIGIDPYPFNLSFKKKDDLKQLQWWPNQPKCGLKEPYLKSQQQKGDRTQKIIDVQPAKIKEFSQYHRIFLPARWWLDEKPWCFGNIQAARWTSMVWDEVTQNRPRIGTENLKLVENQTTKTPRVVLWIFFFGRLPHGIQTTSGLKGEIPNNPNEPWKRHQGVCCSCPSLRRCLPLDWWLKTKGESCTPSTRFRAP